MSLNELLDHTPRLGRYVSLSIIHGDGRPRPDENVFDARLEAIRPIVQQDGIVSAIVEWDGRVVTERMRRDGLVILGRPIQPLFDHKIRDAAIRFLGLIRPTQVLVQIRRQAFELFELIVGFKKMRTSVRFQNVLRQRRMAEQQAIPMICFKSPHVVRW